MQITISTEEPSLPVALPDGVESIPAFDPVRRHAALVSHGATLLIGASIAMGAGLANLADKAKRTHGGSRKKSELGGRPWLEISTEQTGLSRETNRRCEKVARDLAHQLKGKRDKSSTRLRSLLADPEAEWTADDYRAAAQVCGAVYDADTWTGILQEVGIIRKKPEPKQLETKKKTPRISLVEQARIAALGLQGSLRSVASDPKKWRKRLAAMPVDPTGDETTPSLRELQADLQARITEVAETIEKKLN